jgi:Flp pilus assembly protein TadD
MSNYAFLRSNASLVTIGLAVGLFGGFKIANSQYRSQQAQSLNRAVAQATGGMSNPAADGEVRAMIDKAKANPNDAEAQMDAASQFIQIERPQEALPFLEQADKARPNDPRIMAGLGVAHFMLGQFDEAAGWLKRSRAAGASEPTVTSLLIGSYIHTGKNLDEADKLLKELEAQGLDSSKLARIREDLNAARSGNSRGAEAKPETKPGARSVLDHGPEEPKVKPAKPSGGKN